MKDIYAVFGGFVKRSKSPTIHQLFALQTKQNIDYRIESIPDPDLFQDAVLEFFRSGGKGLNIGAPYKEVALEVADLLSSRAKEAKSVNTLLTKKDGQIYGDNTDGVGLIRDLKLNCGLDLKGKRILLIGSGGTARGVFLPILKEMPSRFFVANRTVSKAINLAETFSKKTIAGCCVIKGGAIPDLTGESFDLVINAASTGTSEVSPKLPNGILAESSAAYDAYYNSYETPFLNWARNNNAVVLKNGLGMLVEQAAESFYVWRGVLPERVSVINSLMLTK